MLPATAASHDSSSGQAVVSAAEAVFRLPGGEAQRACLARTLLTDPSVLLMDEPTSSLDLAASQLLERLAMGLAHGGVAVVWVSHDLEQVRRIADECIVLLDGRLADPAVG